MSRSTTHCNQILSNTLQQHALSTSSSTNIATQHTETTQSICVGSFSQKKPTLVLLFCKRDLRMYEYIYVHVHVCICIYT
mmetsp:Transcript_96875/g.141714  ORF Transcript_96875/g.141714 Transcript_96875/m.141714 type:complete len:80 (-) Transcript_96875:34-273(-)